MTEKLSNTQKRIFWQEHINAHSTLNISQNEYCRQHSISAFKFSYWKGRLVQTRPVPITKLTAKPTTKESSPSVFTQIKVQPEEPTSGITIHLSSGSKLAGINSSNYALAVKLAGELS